MNSAQKFVLLLIKYRYIVAVFSAIGIVLTLSNAELSSWNWISGFLKYDSTFLSISNAIFIALFIFSVNLIISFRNVKVNAFEE